MGDIKSFLNQKGIEIQDFPIQADKVAALIQLIESGKISTTIGSQKIFPEMIQHPDEQPIKIAERLNVIQESDENAIQQYIQEVIDSNPTEVERYRNGEKQLTGFLMGQLMKISKGKADPKAANQLLREALDNN